MTGCSAALGAGGNIGTADDVDGEVRPQPDATNPDIGADEHPLDAIATECDFDPPTITCSGDVSETGGCDEQGQHENADRRDRRDIAQQ